MAKSKICPECGSKSCARIIYGLPVLTRKLLEQLRKARIILGGPVEEDYSPQWKCHDCGAEIYERRTGRPSPPREIKKKRIER